jgi:hypothetical protein
VVHVLIVNSIGGKEGLRERSAEPEEQPP